MTDNFPAQLRMQATIALDARVRKMLYNAAEAVSSAVADLSVEPTWDRMKRLNAAWAIGARAMKIATRGEKQA